MARDKELIAHARENRRQATPAEDRLWRLLRAAREMPVKFSRQVVIGPFIVDLAARSAKLAIEVDGASHGWTGEQDERRTAFLASKGYRVIRFSNDDVMRNGDGVLASIREALGTSPLPGALRAPVPPPASGGRAG